VRRLPSHALLALPSAYIRRASRDIFIDHLKLYVGLTNSIRYLHTIRRGKATGITCTATQYNNQRLDCGRPGNFWTAWVWDRLATAIGVSGRNKTKPYGQSTTGRECEVHPTFPKTDLFGNVVDKKW